MSEDTYEQKIYKDTYAYLHQVGVADEKRKAKERAEAEYEVAKKLVEDKSKALRGYVGTNQPVKYVNIDGDLVIITKDRIDKEKVITDES